MQCLVVDQPYNYHPLGVYWFWHTLMLLHSYPSHWMPPGWPYNQIFDLILSNFYCKALWTAWKSQRILPYLDSLCLSNTKSHSHRVFTFNITFFICIVVWRCFSYLLKRKPRSWQFSSVILHVVFPTSNVLAEYNRSHLFLSNVPLVITYVWMRSNMTLFCEKTLDGTIIFLIENILCTNWFMIYLH